MRRSLTGVDRARSKKYRARSAHHLRGLCRWHVGLQYTKQKFYENITLLMKYWIAYADFDGFRLDAVKHVTADFTAYFSSVGTLHHILGRTISLLSVRSQHRQIGLDSTWVACSVIRRIQISMATCQKGVTKAIEGVKDIYLNNSAFPLPGLNAAYGYNVWDGKRCTAARSGEQ